MKLKVTKENENRSIQDSGWAVTENKWRNCFLAVVQMPFGLRLEGRKKELGK